ncbi:MAG: cellulase family glycosylhydrolase [Panacagrimonas sp.]
MARNSSPHRFFADDFMLQVMVAGNSVECGMLLGELTKATLWLESTEYSASVAMSEDKNRWSPLPAHVGKYDPPTTRLISGGKTQMKTHFGGLRRSLALLSLVIAWSAPSYAVDEIPLSGLSVVGNQIHNADGQSVFVHGVNRMGHEYHCIQGWDFGHGPQDQKVLDGMKSWNINAVRVLLNEHCWLDIDTNGTITNAYMGKPYRDAVVAWVSLITANNMIAIVDLHASAAGTRLALGQDPMPNVDHSIDFWRDVASTFKGNSSVMLELFNEPTPENATRTATFAQKWRCLLDGREACAGLLPDLHAGYAGFTGSRLDYLAVGVQELVSTIRATGATNIILAPGIDYTGKVADWPRYKPYDPLDNLAVSWHTYNYGTSCSDEACWNYNLGNTWLSAPIVLTEFGVNRCDDGAFNKAFMTYIQKKKQGFLGFVWQTVKDCEGHALVTDAYGSPSQYGRPFRDHIQNLPWTHDIGELPPRTIPEPATAPSPVANPVPSPEPIPDPAPTPDPTPAPSTNLLLNPDFESGSFSPWFSFQAGGATGKVALDPSVHVQGANSARITVTDPKSTGYFFALYQQGLVLNGGRTYTLSFSAKAEWDREIEVLLTHEQAPWTAITDQRPLLSTSWKRFAYTFTVPVTASGQLVFGLAKNAGHTWLDSISLHQH